MVVEWNIIFHFLQFQIYQLILKKFPMFTTIILHPPPIFTRILIFNNNNNIKLQSNQTYSGLWQLYINIFWETISVYTFIWQTTRTTKNFNSLCLFNNILFIIRVCFKYWDRLYTKTIFEILTYSKIWLYFIKVLIRR